MLRLLAPLLNRLFRRFQVGRLRLRLAHCDFTIAVSPSRFSLCGSIEPTFTVEVASINGFVDLVSLNVLGLPPGTSALFSENPVMPPGTSTLALSGFASLPPGVYALTVDGTSTDRSRSAEATVAVEVDCHPAPAFSVGGMSSSSARSRGSGSWRCCVRAPRGRERLQLRSSPRAGGA